MTQAVDKLLRIARAEVGYLEKASNSRLDEKTANAGGRNYTKFARDLDALGAFNGKKQGYAWCAVFALWCFYKAFGLTHALGMTGQTLKGSGAGCTQAAGYFKAIRRFYTSSPEPGDWIFFTGDGGKTCSHVGIVVKVENNRVYTIEGNTSGGSTVIANGGAVCEKNYALTYNRIAGYGRPNWDIVKEEVDMTKEEVKALVKSEVTEAMKDVTATIAAAVKEAMPMETVYHHIEEVPEWYRAEIKALVDSGALKGDSGGDLRLSEEMCRVLAVMVRMAS